MVDNINHINLIDIVNHFEVRMDTPLINSLFTLMQHYRITIRNVINANELGLNAMHVRCLHLIDETESCTANDIVQKTQRDKAQIARLVKELIALKLIEKKASIEDKRRFILSFTHQGNALLTKLLEAQQQINQHLCAGISEAEIQMVLSVVDKMNSNVESRQSMHLLNGLDKRGTDESA